MAQAWLLGVCAILGLRLGGDALRCSDCEIKNPEDTCEGTCEASGAFAGCMVRDTFEGDNFKKRWETCYGVYGSYRCGATESLKNGNNYKYRCCADEDLCNRKL